MSIDNKILKELSRHNSINKYILEQDALTPEIPTSPEGDLPPVPPAPEGDLPPVPPAPETGSQSEPSPIDVESDPDVEKIDNSKETDEKNELEVTDLVKSQEKIEQKQEEYFDELFKHLDDLETKLSNMDQIVQQLNNLETKIEKYRVKTPEEKLELRSLDSGPFNQKLSDFFEDKQEDMEKTGKNEYILTQDDVENYSSTEVKKSFRDFGDDNSEDFIEVR